MTRIDQRQKIAELEDLVAELRGEVFLLQKQLEQTRTGGPPSGTPGAAPAGAASPGKGAPPEPRPPSGSLPPDTYEIVFDGGSLGNPGKGYGSFVLFSPKGKSKHEKLTYPEFGLKMTNNQAEYLTLVRALERLQALIGGRTPATTVSIVGDSNLVVNQVNGAWKVKNADLQPLHRQVRALLDDFAGWSIRWHDRSNSVDLLGH